MAISFHFTGSMVHEAVEFAPGVREVSPPIREWNSRGKTSTACHSLSRPRKAHSSSQWLCLFCRKCDALLAAEFHGIQDLLEARMLADVGQQRFVAQPG